MAKHHEKPKICDKCKLVFMAKTDVYVDISGHRHIFCKTKYEFE